MGWSVGFDEKWKRWVGYGVPAVCDQPGCDEPIDRGLSYVCGSEPYGGEYGCGLFFCSEHMGYEDDRDNVRGGRSWQGCERCIDGDPPYEPKPDTAEWIEHMETDPSWAEWRAERDAKAST
jgi:hypothetical protein